MRESLYVSKSQFLDRVWHDSNPASGVRNSCWHLHVDKRFHEGLANPRNCYSSIFRDTNDGVPQGSVFSVTATGMPGIFEYTDDSTVVENCFYPMPEPIAPKQKNPA